MTDVKARIIGCRAQMEKFDFYFGLEVGLKIFVITDNLATTLQGNKMTAISGQKLARLTIDD